jgi:hypothetical protein
MTRRRQEKKSRSKMLGKRFITVTGEIDDNDGRKRITKPGSTGQIVGFDSGLYDLTFRNGAWVRVSLAELRNPTLYQEVGRPPISPATAKELVHRLVEDIEPADILHHLANEAWRVGREFASNGLQSDAREWKRLGNKLNRLSIEASSLPVSDQEGS